MTGYYFRKVIIFNLRSIFYVKHTYRHPFPKIPHVPLLRWFSFGLQPLNYQLISRHQRRKIFIYSIASNKCSNGFPYYALYVQQRRFGRRTGGGAQRRSGIYRVLGVKIAAIPLHTDGHDSRKTFPLIPVDKSTAS